MVLGLIVILALGFDVGQYLSVPEVRLIPEANVMGTRP